MKLVKTSEVHTNPKNPRIIKDANYKKLLESLRTFPKMMDKRPLVVVSKNGGYEVLGGNMRLKAIQELGWEKVPVDVADDWNEAERSEFIIKDNVGFGDWDWDALVSEWTEFPLADWGVEVPDWRTASEDDYEAPPLEDVKTDIVRGDLIEIGAHRLLCGDSTVKEDVDRLMGGKKADMFFSDPPYAIYGSSTGVDVSVADDKMVLPFFRVVIRIMKEHCKMFGHGYVCCDWRSWSSWITVSRDIVLKVSNMIVWDKGDFGLGGSYRELP